VDVVARAHERDETRYLARLDVAPHDVVS
jgi:hypothetical protein